MSTLFISGAKLDGDQKATEEFTTCLNTCAQTQILTRVFEFPHKRH